MTLELLRSTRVPITDGGIDVEPREVAAVEEALNRVPCPSVGWPIQVHHRLSHRVLEPVTEVILGGVRQHHADVAYPPQPS